MSVRTKLLVRGLCFALCVFAQGAVARPRQPLDWDSAFVDRSGARPLHFVAEYLDGKGGTHRLEEWRTGLAHLRRKTDARIDLHADAAAAVRAGRPMDYVWQILDMEKRIDHRVTSAGMLRAGMLYSYYSMAHVLSRPVGELALRELRDVTPVRVAGQACRWFEIDVRGQAATRVCWAQGLGIPLATRVDTGKGWKTTFTVQALDARVSPAVFAVDSRGFQVRNVDELSTED